jgi:hypothetical protein
MMTSAYCSFYIYFESTLNGLAACRLKKREQAWQDKAP